MSRDKETDNDNIEIEKETTAAARQNKDSGSAVNDDLEVQETFSDSEPEPQVVDEEQLRNRLEELEDKLLRTLAEFDNYRKRTSRQFEEMAKAANDKLIVEFIEIVDNFDRALLATNIESDPSAYRKGAELILNQMHSLLSRYDVTPIEALGQLFDPNLHEAIMQVPTDEYPDGVVALEINKGYRMGDRIIRHSRVGVSTGKKQA